MGYHLFYRSGIALYHLFIRIAALWSPKAKAWLEGRKTVWPTPPADKKNVWFHASSLGEFEQGRPVMEAWKKARPNDHIVLSFFSPSGFAISLQNIPADTIMYLPEENIVNARKWIAHWQPVQAIFFKYDFWLTYIREAEKAGVPVAFTSVLLNPSKFMFQWYGKWYLKQLRKVSQWICHDKDTADLLHTHEFKGVSIAGDTRIDRVKERMRETFHDHTVEAFCRNSVSLMMGSSWQHEERMISKIIQEFPDLKIVIAPHDISAAHIREIQEQLPTKTHLWSKGEVPNDCRVLIIDTIGLLSGIYRYASMAFIGGGFGKSVHNTLEPAAYGLAVAFGPNHQKFREPSEMIDLGFGHCVNTVDDLQEFIQKYRNSTERENAKKKSELFFNKHAGATEKTIQTLLELHRKS
ncbi:MAG: hypothetical protein EA358_07385 [Flavobacteriales bacterium]|nr:MAG: hypothetical protein EA358_07385 [Flavobacteriales bacterium]